MSFGRIGLKLRLRTFNVPGSPGPPRVTRKGSTLDKVMSFPSGPIRFPTVGSAEPERQWMFGMNFRVTDKVVMRLLLERTLVQEPDETTIPAPV